MLATNISFASTSTLTCNNNVVTIDASASTSGSNITYQWSGNGIIGNANGPVVQVNQGGIFTLTLSNGNCSNAQSIEVLQNFETPVVDAGGNVQIDCNTACVILNATATIGSGNLNYLWNGPNGYSSNLLNPQVCQPGNYSLVVTSQNGCTATDALLVEEQFVQLSTSLNQNICAGDCFTLGAETFCQSGNYEINLSSVNGCDSLIQLELAILDTDIQIQSPQMFTCNNNSVELNANATVAGPGINYLWSSLDGQISGNPNDLVVEALSPGTYLFELDNNGCQSQQSIQVFEETDTLWVSAGADQQVYCQNESITLLPSLTTLSPPFEVQWNGPDGFSSNELNPQVSQAGIYQLLLTNTSNGCTAEDVVKVEIEAAMEVVVQSQAACEDLPSGSLLVEEVLHGTPPFQFALDGTDFQSAPLFEGVGIGDHLLRVMDSEGCLTETMVSIDEIEAFSLEMDPTYFSCGEEGAIIQPMIEGQTNLDELNYLWSDGATERIRQLSSTGPHWVEVSNTCTTIRQNFEIVSEFPSIKDLVYTPNAFSPNDDGANDLYKMESDLTFLAYQLSIYDRWGNLVFQTDNIETGWDGRLNGRLAPIGVYAWILYGHVESCKGINDFMWSGDLTLLR
ncbi:MAG: gliding motility-associated C-terminal domain-containing protein [Bacteroidota bacterium]